MAKKTGSTLQDQIDHLKEKATTVQIDEAQSLSDTKDEVVLRLAFKLLNHRKANEIQLSAAERLAYKAVLETSGQEAAEAWRERTLAAKNNSK